MSRYVTIAAAVIGLALSSCGGDDTKAETSPAPSVAAPSVEAPPASDPSQLPTEFVKCMEDKGYEATSSADIHSAPPEVLQACFGSLHGGSGTP